MDPFTLPLVLFLVLILLATLAQLIWVQRELRFQKQVLAELATLREFIEAKTPSADKAR